MHCTHAQQATGDMSLPVLVGNRIGTVHLSKREFEELKHRPLWLQRRKKLEVQWEQGGSDRVSSDKIEYARKNDSKRVQHHRAVVGANNKKRRIAACTAQGSTAETPAFVEPFPSDVVGACLMC